MLDPSALKPIMSVSVCQRKSRQVPVEDTQRVLTILATPFVILKPWALVWGRKIAHVPHNR